MIWRWRALLFALLAAPQLHASESANDASARLSLTVSVSRPWNCVAPCYVFFDARESSSPETKAPFHEIDYSWDFGDPAAGAAWARGARTGRGSKNIGKGPIAAHVYEAPGTYTVTLTAHDGRNTAQTASKLLVSDPDTVFAGPNTLCVAADSVPVAGTEGCPPGAQAYRQADWPTIVNSYATAGKRVLLKRGDAFSGPPSAHLNRSGPGILGAFGAGANPVIRTTGAHRNSTLLSMTSASDWRIMDLDFDGQAVVAGDNGTYRNFVMATGSQRQLLFLRVTARNLGGGMVFGLANGPAPHDQVALVDSAIQRLWSNSTAAGLGIFLSGTRLAVIGNLFSDSTLGTAEHMVRIQHMNGGVISNNTIEKVNPTKEMIAVRAICSSPCGGAGPYVPAIYGSGEAAATRWVVISDNHLKTNSYVGMQIDTAGSNTSATAIIRDVIVERNWHVAQGGSGNSGVRLRAQDATVRNELVDLTLANIAHAVQIFGATQGDPVGSRNIRVYNNSVVALGPWVGDNGGLRIAEFISAAGVTDVRVQNNLAYAPNAGKGRIRGANDAGIATYEGVLGTWLCTNNSTGAHGSSSCGPRSNQIKLANPQFAVFPPTIPAHWKPRQASYAVGAGVRVPVWSDFLLTPYPARRDLGAVAH